MPTSASPTEERTTNDAPAATAPLATPVQLGTPPVAEDHVAPADAWQPTMLPVVTLVLGIAAAALGVSVIWYPAAIALGLGTIVVGAVTMRRTRAETDSRVRRNAAVGTMLGALAIVLGACAAFLLPHALDRVDGFFSAVRHDVNHNVDAVSRGLRSDVNSLDRSTTRDLRRLERQNRTDLSVLERRSNDSLANLSSRLEQVETRLSDAERRDLTRLEQSLRQDIRDLDAAMHTSSDSLGERIAKLEQEMADLQRTLHG
jgi:hypothetical protein